MRRYIQRVLVITLILAGTFAAGAARAGWRQLDQTYINDQLVCRDGMRFGVALAEFGGATTTAPITTTFGVARNTSGRPAPNQGQVCCGGSAYGSYLVSPRTLTLPYSATPITITPPGGFSAPSNHVLANGLVRFNQVVAAGSNVVVTFPGQVSGPAGGLIPGGAGAHYDAGGLATLNDAARYQFPVQNCMIYSDMRVALSDSPDPVTGGQNVTYAMTVTNGGTMPINTHAVPGSASSLTIPTSGKANPFPAQISVNGLTGRIARLRVVISGITHANAGDLDILLVAPDGSNTLLMSDSGEGQALTNRTLTFDDSGATLLPPGATPAFGTVLYRPSNYAPDEDFSSVGGPTPSDPLPYGDKLAALNGGRPNGVWQLYVLDDKAGSGGTIAGWSLNITTDPAPIIASATLPSTFALVNASGTNWACGYANHIVSCRRTVSSMPVGAAEPIQIVARATVNPGAYVTSATVSQPVPDTNTANNSVAQRTIVAAPRAEDTAYAVRYDGWTGVMDAQASGGAYRTTGGAGQTASYTTPVATSVSWITYHGPGQGRAEVFIDNISKGIIDLYAATPTYRVVHTYSGLTNARHTIKVVVLSGTAHGIQVHVDGFRYNSTTVEDSALEVVWTHWIGRQSSNAAATTYRQATQAGAVTIFSFSGPQITWITSLGPVYGKAQVLIDNVDKGVLDLYSPTVQWRVEKQFGGLSGGAHTIVVRALGTRNPSATDSRVMIDAFRVP